MTQITDNMNICLIKRNLLVILKIVTNRDNFFSRSFRITTYHCDFAIKCGLFLEMIKHQNTRRLKYLLESKCPSLPGSDSSSPKTMVTLTAGVLQLSLRVAWPLEFREARHMLTKWPIRHQRLRRFLYLLVSKMLPNNAASSQCLIDPSIHDSTNFSISFCNLLLLSNSHKSWKNKNTK